MLGGHAYLGFNLPKICGSDPATYSCEIWPAVAKFSSAGRVEWIARLAHDGRVARDLAGIDLDEAGRCVLAARTVRYDGTGTGFVLGLLDEDGNQYPGNLYEKRSTNWTWDVWSPRFDGLGGIRIGVQRSHLSVDHYVPWIARFTPYRQRGTPEIEQPPTSQFVQSGTNITLNVVAAGRGRLRYQWRLNGVAIAGATSTNLLLAAIQSTQSGDYSVEVRNSRGKVVTADARVTVSP